MDNSRRQIFFFFFLDSCFSGLFPLLTVLSGFLGNSPFLPMTAKPSWVSCGQATGWTFVAEVTQQGGGSVPRKKKAIDKAFVVAF